MMAALLLLLLQAPVELGLKHYSAGDFETARKHLQQAVAAQPKSFDARFLLGATLVQLHRREEAIAQLRQAHLLNPMHADARKLLASQYVAARRFVEAVKLLDPAVDEETHLLLIEARQGAGDSAGAFALARQAAEKFPKSGQIRAWLGFQLQFAGRYEEAKAELWRAFELEPAFPMTFHVMGDVLLKQENFKEAVKWLKQAAAEMPGDTETLLSLSRALTGTGDVKAAIESLSAAPRNEFVHLQLSRLYFQLGDEARARQEAELSIRLRDEAARKASSVQTAPPGRPRP